MFKFITPLRQLQILTFVISVILYIIADLIVGKMTGVAVLFYIIGGASTLSVIIYSIIYIVDEDVADEFNNRYISWYNKISKDNTLTKF